MPAALEDDPLVTRDAEGQGGEDPELADLRHADAERPMALGGVDRRPPPRSRGRSRRPAPTQAE